MNIHPILRFFNITNLIESSRTQKIKQQEFKGDLEIRPENEEETVHGDENFIAN